VSDQTDRKHRNIAIAKMGALNGLGFLCGPAVGGLFAPLGVQAPFIAAGLIGILTIPLAMKFLTESTERTEINRERASFFGSFPMFAKQGYWQLFTVTFGVSMASSSFFGLLGYFMIDRFQASATFV